jgi:hypothetical protein
MTPFQKRQNHAGNFTFKWYGLLEQGQDKQEIFIRRKKTIRGLRDNSKNAEM